MRSRPWSRPWCCCSSRCRRCRARGAGSRSPRASHGCWPSASPAWRSASTSSRTCWPATSSAPPGWPPWRRPSAPGWPKDASAAVTSGVGAAVPLGRALRVQRRLALGDREAALVEGLADDHAGEVDLAQAGERAEVVEVADPARVQEAPAHGLRDVADVVEVGPLEPAVAVDVRVDEGGHAAVAEAADRVAGRHLGRLCPARGGDVAAADVDRDEHARAERGDDRVEEVDVAERRGADDHALGARPQRLADGLEGAQAPAVLHRHARLARDPAQVLDRLRLAGARAVEVDDVEEPRARLDPRPRGRQRIVVVDGRVLEAALDEAHRPAVEDVDGGIEDHAAATKFASSASPSREDFSGWNWTPATLSRSTIEAKHSPYSPRPTTSPASRGRQTNECTW